MSFPQLSLSFALCVHVESPLLSSPLFVSISVSRSSVPNWEKAPLFGTSPFEGGTWKGHVEEASVGKEGHFKFKIFQIHNFEVIYFDEVYLQKLSACYVSLLLQRWSEKVDPRLRDLAPTARRGQDAGSQNLEPTFF